MSSPSNYFRFIGEAAAATDVLKGDDDAAGQQNDAEKR
jgi:hypothetical protein